MANGGERERILIVDDEAASRITLSCLLRDDYEVMSASSADEALEICSGEPLPDLIISDVYMPGELDGHALCRCLKSDPRTYDLPVLLISGHVDTDQETLGLESGAVDFLAKPLNPPIVLARIRTHLALADQGRLLEQQVQQRTRELHSTQEALRKAMNNLRTTRVTDGVFWVQIPEAGLYILCGCPAEVVKHLMRHGYIATETRKGVQCETGPNAILLSDLSIQNGQLANLAEFPVLQMLYRQGMLIPGHPNNTGAKPILIGSPEQLASQLAYIHRGNYGLLSQEEIEATGALPEEAELLMRIKRKFAFGQIRTPEEFVDTVEIGSQASEIMNGVTIRRLSLNRFEIAYRGHNTTVDLNLSQGQVYRAPYMLDHHLIERSYFAVVHSGQGDGWDIDRPSMSSVVMFQGGIYLVDAPPNIEQILACLGIDISEVQGLFHTHAHDDHFAGLPALMRAGHRIRYYSTPLVRAAVIHKFSALMGLDRQRFGEFFEICDLVPDHWNDIGGFEVRPIFSPHPVETSLYLFRALDYSGYRSYAHWADLSAFPILDQMTYGPEDLRIPPEFVEKVKQDYLIPADIKKLDIGGGLIHGRAEDFEHDSSPRIILSHIQRLLTPREKEIGSAASFGAIDVLIDTQQDYLRQIAFRHLSSYFPEAPGNSLRVLLNSPMVTINAGTIIRRRGTGTVDHVDLIISGQVEYIDAERGVGSALSTGAFIGEQAIFNEELPPGTWRAVSHVNLLQMPVRLLRNFLVSNGLSQRIEQLVHHADLLRDCPLFGEQITFAVLQRIASEMQLYHLPEGESFDLEEHRELCLLISGRLKLFSHDGNLVETLTSGAFCGEEALFGGIRSGSRVVAVSDAIIQRIAIEPLKEIPVVHWKLIEMSARRRELTRGSAD
jgi:hemerythrin